MFVNTGDKRQVIFSASLGLVPSSQDQRLQCTDPNCTTAYSQARLFFVPKAGLHALNRSGQGPLGVHTLGTQVGMASSPGEQGKGRVEGFAWGGVKAQPGKVPTRFCWQAVT